MVIFYGLCEHHLVPLASQWSPQAFTYVQPRGVKKANARLVTSAMLGAFEENWTTRAEFFERIGRRRVDSKQGEHK